MSPRTPMSSTWMEGCSPPVSSTHTCTPYRAVSSACGATCPRTPPARSTSPPSRGTPRRTRTGAGSSAGGGRWPPSREAHRQRRTSTASSRPSGVPAQPRPPRRLGQHPRAGDRRDHARDPRPTARTLRARHRGSSHRHPPRGAMHTVVRHAPETTPEDYYRALLTGKAYLHSVGVTGWQDAIVGAYAGMDDPGPTYLLAAQRGQLTAHVVGALWWDRDGGEEQVASLMARRAEYTQGRFRPTSVKVMQDGVAENGTAALTTPYLDRRGHRTCNGGHSFVDPEALKRYVARLDAEGFQVHVHGIGDRGVREALDAFGSRPSRPAAPHRARPARAPRRRTALRPTRGGRQHAGTVGLPGRPDDRPDTARPRRGKGAVAVPLR